MIDVLTCILNGYDNLREPVVRSPGVRFLCYTDEPRIDSGWQIQPAARLFGCATRDSRMPKILSHLHCGADAQRSVWMDGCFRPKTELRDFIAESLQDADIAAFIHPRRSMWSEVAYIRQAADELGFDDETVAAIIQQAERYRSDGFPGEPFVCGGIILRHENEAVRAFNELWWKEYRAGVMRDQFSLAYALWKSGIRLSIIDLDILTQNPGFEFHFHANMKDLSDNPQFRNTREAMAIRLMQLKALYNGHG